MTLRTKNTVIAAALALALAGSAMAQAEAPAAPERGESADAARTEMRELEQEMAALGRRMAELARESGQARDGVMDIRLGPPRIGMGVVLGETRDGGARIAAVTPGGPAAKAGLRSGDVIRSVHGKTTATPEDLMAALRGVQKGQAVNVGYLRDGRSAAMVVVLDELDGAATFNWVGSAPRMTTRRVEVISENGKEGAGVARRIVMHGDPGNIEVFRCVDGEGDCSQRVMRQAFRFSGLNLSSIDAKLGRYFGTDKGVLLIAESDALPGLESGDVITAVDGRDATHPRDVMRALGDKKVGDTVSLSVLRDRRARDIEVTVPESRPLDFLPLPPAPPAPPAPPRPGSAPPAPPPPPAAPGTAI